MRIKPFKEIFLIKCDIIYSAFSKYLPLKYNPLCGSLITLEAMYTLLCGSISM